MDIADRSRSQTWDKQNNYKRPRVEAILNMCKCECAVVIEEDSIAYW